MFASYVTVPVYEAFFRWLGYGEQIDEMVAAWAAKDREAAIAAAPWELIEDTFIFGTPEEMRERLEAFVAGRHHAAGPHADHDARPDGRADRAAYAAINAGGQPPGPVRRGRLERARTGPPGPSTSRPSRGRPRA